MPLITPEFLELGRKLNVLAAATSKAAATLSKHVTLENKKEELEEMSQKTEIMILEIKEIQAQLEKLQ